MASGKLEFNAEFEEAVEQLIITYKQPDGTVRKIDGKVPNRGPPAFSGSILDDPDALWTEDFWDENRITEAQEKIIVQGAALSQFWRRKYTEKASAYWHKFYQRNEDHFYKDRHYLQVVFPELEHNISSNREIHLLEVGCGVGNAVLPLIDLNPLLHVTAIDFAKSAIEILKGNDIYRGSKRIEAHVCCVSSDPLPVGEGSVDYVLCLFVLSAIAPEKHKEVLQKLFNALKPGGKLFVRDYGRYDEAQLRFKKGSKLEDNFYVRQDGTCSYFFEIESFRALLGEVGFRCEECSYIQRQYANRQDKKARYRVWIHGKFVKPQ